MEKENLLKKWITLKAKEDALKAQRKDVESDILGFFEIPKGQKSKSFDENGFKIEIKESETVTIDQIIVESLAEKYDPKILPFKKEYKLDSPKYKSLKDFEENFYNLCSKAVTVKPGSISVKVTKKEG